ncbi:MULTISPECIES: IS110 family transposase [unclassified Microcoleus]|uniref:IS110 family transposase n=1 Tax=unclassified Microcoleus TaxID=2642155 RepID=UPI002FD73A3E
MGEVFDYENGCKLAAYAGFTPCECNSGTSIKGKTRLSYAGNIRLRKALYLLAVVAMPCNPLLKANRCAIIGLWKGQNAGDWCNDIGSWCIGFGDFKIPKAFRSQLCDRYRLTGQDSIYKTLENIIVFGAVLLGMGIYSQKLVFYLLPLYYRNRLGIAREILLAKVGIARVFNCLVCCRA